MPDVHPQIQPPLPPAEVWAPGRRWDQVLTPTGAGKSVVTKSLTAARPSGLSSSAAAHGGGFGPAALRFFDELADNNSREFWTAHLEVFEREVKAPMAALLASLPEAYQPFRVFRMNRDLRFSENKSPYKTQHSGVHGSGGIDCYVHLDGGGFLAGCGIYQMERDQLERYRAAVDDARTGRALERLLDDLGAGVDLGMGAEPLRTPPRPRPGPPRIDLLRRRGLVAHQVLTGPPLADGRAVRDFVVQLFEVVEPLNRWLRRHVGETVEHRGPG